MLITFWISVKAIWLNMASSKLTEQKMNVFCILNEYYILYSIHWPHKLECKLFSPIVTFLESSSKNIKLVKFLSHRKYLPTPYSPHTSTSLTLFQPYTWCMCVCLYVCVWERESLWARLHRCVCVYIYMCGICPITAVYSRDFSHGNLVYLLYLQYNASVNISNFETQVSISRLAAVCACSCVCSARCREEMNTAAKETARL